MCIWSIQTRATILSRDKSIVGKGNRILGYSIFIFSYKILCIKQRNVSEILDKWYIILCNICSLSSNKKPNILSKYLKHPLRNLYKSYLQYRIETSSFSSFRFKDIGFFLLLQNNVTKGSDVQSSTMAGVLTCQISFILHKD